jgi:23S rRNA pseudouridine1911/1915/1917 synthase
MPVAEDLSFVVLANERLRLEDFIFLKFPGLSRMYLRDVIKTANCEVNGRFENRGYKLRPGDFVEIRLDPSRANAMRPEDLPLKIIFEDGHLLVIDKPAGMLVHPTHKDKTGTLLNALAFHLNPQQSDDNRSSPRSDSAVLRPGLVHRLDRETSGLIVVAKDVRTHRVLANQFQTKRVRKLYVALVNGRVGADEGVIDSPIGRFADRKFWDVKADGKPATTRFQVLRRRAFATLLELEPVTGRTNQLRIHCASIGHPIVGDKERSGAEAARLFLHAAYLQLRHPVTGAQLSFGSEVPKEFADESTQAGTTSMTPYLSIS